jgi:hypothetical protein
MYERIPRIGDLVAMPRGLIEIAYTEQGIVFLKDAPQAPIHISNLKPSLDGRPNVWVIVPK